MALCSRIDLSASDGANLLRLLDNFTGWDPLLVAAQAHGLGPLVYWHLSASRAEVPPLVWRGLEGIYLRHRQANRMRIRELGAILTAFEAVGISAIVLKGAALAHMIYPEPGLRPLGDVDILVEKAQVKQARKVLTTLGFVVAMASDPAADKHLVFVKTVDGFQVVVELHYHLLAASHRTTATLDPKINSPFAFIMGEQTAFTLGREAMLWHLCQHMVFHADVFLPVRLIWATDIVSFAECFVSEIDWEYVRHHFPLVRNVLSLLQQVTPLSKAVQDRLSISMPLHRQETWGDFRGWPRASVAHLRQQGNSYCRILQDTFFPSTWWLRLHYGLSNTHTMLSYRFFWHPIHILSWAAHLARERLEFYPVA
ncbi:MAG: nucleotidyltransferase family protein [Dehalococcoidia bacterium]|nr:nucleotidyltransferase family protein [Dehalococcoidia bacterium]